MTTAEDIEQRLRAALGAIRVEIVDESAAHAGHAGAASGGGHFRCLVVADAFRGLSTIERHRRVYGALGELMQHDIHALALRTLAPEEPGP